MLHVLGTSLSFPFNYPARTSTGRLSRLPVLYAIRSSGVYYKLSGANGDRENPIFLVQLTTSRIGNRTRLMPNLLKVTTTHTHTLTVGLPICNLGALRSSCE